MRLSKTSARVCEADIPFELAARCIFGYALTVNARTFSAMTLILLATAALAGDLHAESPEERLRKFSDGLKVQFSEIETLSVEQLAAMEQRPVLLDVRAAKEFAVSRIPGAIHAEADAARQLQELGVDASDPVVVYCSIGYRSSLLSQKLQEAGFINVRNLEGSIFAWSHEGHELVDDNGPTQGVHPYNHWWGRYLRQELWQWKAAQPGPGTP